MTHNFPGYKQGKTEARLSIGLGWDGESVNIAGAGIHDGIGVGATWWKGDGFKNKK